MKRQIIFLLVVIIMQIPHKANAQVINGRIIDEQNLPISFVNVILLNRGDSTFVKGTVSKDDGTFSIESDNKDGILKISGVGYKTVYADVGQGNVGDIRLQPEAYMLNDVTIRAKRPQFKISEEGMVVDIQNSLLKQAGTADDVLSQLPRITGSNGNFTVFGKGAPIIYINNRRLTNMAELSQLKSSDVKEVEVITNPGAQYGSTVEAVIRIKTVRPRGDGWSFSPYSFANFSRKFSSSQSFNLKYRHNNLEVFSNFSISSLHNNQYSEFEQTMQGNHLIKETGKDTVLNNGIKQLKGQVGVDYGVNDNHSFGLIYGITESLHDVANATSSLDFSIGTIGQEHTKINSSFTSYSAPAHELDIYYLGKVGKLSIDFNGTYFYNKNRQAQSNEDYSSISGLQQVDVNNVSRSRLWAGKLIFTYPVLKGKLDFGSEYTNSRSEGHNVNVQNIFNSSKTKIKEQNIAGFIDYNILLGNIRLKAGMRFEHVLSNYYSNGIWQEDPSRKYNDWFPNFSLSWSKGKWQTQLGYNAKTSRPSYRSLSSWIQYDNRYEYQGGNPLLRPAKIHSLDFTLTHDWITFTAGYTNTKHYVAYVMQPYKGDIFIKTYANISHIEELYTSVSASPKLGFYQPMYEIRFSKQYFNDDVFGQDVSLNRPLFSLRMLNRFAIRKDFTVSVNLSYHSSYVSSVSVYKEGGSVDVTVYKSFFKNKLSFWLSGRDLLNTQKRKYTMYGINSTFTTNQDMDTRSFSIGIRYNFNTTRNKYKGTGAGNQEKDRL